MDKSSTLSNALDLISALKKQQITLFLSDGQLKFTAPKGAMTPELIEQLRALKPDLIAILEQNERSRLLLEGSIPVTGSEVDGYPLTYAQQRFWFLDQLAGGNSPIYNMLPIVFEARGSLKLDMLKAAFREIVERHEVLSYRFGFLNGQPRQWRGKGGDIEFTICELDKDSSESEQIQRFVLQEGEKPFNLQAGNPLIRLGIIKKSDSHHILVLTLHHICADGWSLGNLIHELSALYEAKLGSKSIQLPEISIQYGDYAQWERTYLDKKRIQQKLHEWNKLLAGAPTFLDLPTDRPRPRLQSFNGSTQAFTIDSALTAKIASISKETGCTPFMILLSVFGLLLSKYSRQTDLVIGSPISNRIHSDTDALIGLFLNTIPLRIDLNNDPSFLDVLQRVKSTAISAFELAEVPFDELLQSLNIERSLNHTPLFQVLFALQNAPAGKLKTGDVELTELEPENSKAPFDLVLSMEETGKTIHGRFRYNTDLFDRPTIHRMSEHFVYLLEKLLGSPNENVTRISITTPSEIDTLRVNRGGTGTFRSDRTIHQTIAEISSNYAHNTALRFDGESYSYEWLEQRSTVIAHELLKSGPQHRKRIGICMDRSPDLIAALVAVIRVGGCYVPLDPVYPSDRLSFMIEDSGLDIVITDNASVASVPGDASRLLNVDALDGAQNTLSVPEVPESSPEDPLYIIYTSGSTGKPKGVEVTHQNVLRLFNATEQLYRFGSDDVWTLFHSYAFDFSVWEIFGALLYGGSLVIVPRSVSRTPDTFFQLLLDEKVTVLNQTPSAFAQLSEVDRQAGGPKNSLKWVIFGGEALDPRSLKGWFDRHGYDSPVLVNMYGITETTVHVTWHVITEKDVAEGASVIGNPIPDLTLDLIDDYGQLVGYGVPGEIVVGGDGVANGYLNRPELNAVRFKTSEIFPGLPPFKAYRSGDLARRRHDGSLQYLGRIDFQVKIRGFRIELGEIESQMASFEGVAAAAVKVVHASGGDEIAGYVVFQKHLDAHEHTQKLRVHLKSKLPEYMVPTGIVVLPEMPLTANGKTDLRALPDPDRESRALQTQFESPRNSLETLIADFWKDILGIDKVGIHDNFFELGGDSIKGAVFANKMQEKLGSIFYVVAIFEAPTIAELVEYIKKHYPEILNQFSDVEVETDSQTGRLTLRDWNIVHDLVPPLAPHDPIKTLPKNPKAIFVLAPPRSGTTLLRVLLGGHSKLFAPPELELMPFNTMRERAETYIGRDSFWLEGSIRAYMEAKNISLDDAKAEIEAFEKAGMSVMEFYGILQRHLNGRILVDKSPSYVLHTSILERIEETFEDAFYVHLHRHPLGMTHSFDEAKLHQIFFRYEHSYTPRQLGELIWAMSHDNIHRFLNQIPAERQSSISFENMTADPESEMKRLCGDIGLDYEPEMLAIYRENELKKRMTDGIHAESRMLGDVKFHTHKKIDSKASDRWREKLDVQSLSDVSRVIAAGFDYDVPAPENPVSESDLSLKSLKNVSKPRNSAQTGIRTLSESGRSTSGVLRPLSHAQRRLWFFDQLDKGQPTYNMPVQLKLSGKLNIEALGTSIKMIQMRHEVLRSVFKVQDGEPVAEIREHADPMGIVDLRHLNAQNREAEIERWIADFSEQPFLLDRGPLFKSVVLICPDDQYFLLINMHHIVSDGWSLGIIAKELEAGYVLHSGIGTTQLPELTSNYADYTLWQDKLIESGEIEKQLSYWAKKLEHLPSLLEIPADLPRPAVKSYKGATYRFDLGKELTSSVKSIAESLKVTPYMVLLSAYGVLLNKYTGKTDLPIGTPVANRRRTDFESLVGFFVNTQVLRLEVDPSDSFKDLVKKVRSVAIEAYSNQDVSFEHLVEVLQPVRNMGYSPLFQVMLTMQTGKMSAPVLPGVKPELFEHQNTISKYDLTLLFAEENDSLACYAEYSTDLFKEWRIRQLGSHFKHILESVAANLTQVVKDVQLLDKAESNKITTTWNTTQKVFDRTGNVSDLIAEMVSKYPNKVAVRAKNGSLTYQELQHQSDQVALGISKLNLPPESLVLISCERTTKLVVGMLGIWKAGHTYVPVDPTFPTERIRMIIEDAKAPLILTDEVTAPHMPEDTPKVTVQDLISKANSAEEFVRPKPAELAYVIFTSGSTGRPKGVMIPHPAVVNFVLSMSELTGIKHSDTMLAVTTISFDIAVLEIWSYLSNGATVELASEEQTKNPDLLIEALKNNDISVMQATPATWTMLVDAGWKGSDSFTCFTGGEALSRKLAYNLVQNCREVWNLYGPTETTVYSVISKIDADILSRHHAVPIGRPIHNTSIYILDDQLNPVPAGYPGTLYIGGSGVARGYLNRPELTKEKFVMDPFFGVQSTPEAGNDSPAIMYNTGDLAQYRSDGTIDYLGRIDQQIKLRGYRIELEEIEHHLNTHESVSKAAVVLQGSGSEARLVAFVVPKEGKKVQHAVISEYLREKMPDYMVPGVIQLVETLPLTPNGKLDRKVLSSQEVRFDSSQEPKKLARDPLELQLSSIWKSVLKVDAVGLDDSFFELGGHSLLAVKLIAAVNASLAIHVPLASLFQHPTLSSFTKYIRSFDQSKSVWPTVIPLKSNQHSDNVLILIPGAGGNIVYLQALASALHADMTIYAVQPPGLDGKTAPCASIQQLAGHYLSELSDSIAEKNVFLAGHSFGGLVAFEMACQLEANPRSTTSSELIILDSAAPQWIQPTGLDWTATKWIQQIADIASHQFGVKLSLESELNTSDKDSEDTMLYYLLDALKKSGVFPAETEVEFLRGFVNVYKSNLQMDYKPASKLSRIPIQLIRSSELQPEHLNDARVHEIRAQHDLGWSEWSKSGITIQQVPGDHLTMLNHPNVSELAQIIAKIITH